MSEREHEMRRDELAAYLLGALDPAEAAELERHLAGCEECRAELTWLRPAALTLPESVERIEPPAELRMRIMEEVQADSSQRSGARGGLFSGRRRSILRPAVGFAVVLAIAAGVAGYAIRDSDSGSSSSTVIAGKAPRVRVTMVRTGSVGTLHFAHLHQLPPDEVLQAWVRRGKRVESAKTLFVPNRDGTATAVIDDMRGVNTVMVTAEPRGGSNHPTSEPVVALAIPQ